MAFFNHSEMSVIKDLFPSLKAPFTFNSFLGAALENPRMKDFLISFNPTELINFFLSQLCLQVIIFKKLLKNIFIKIYIF